MIILGMMQVTKKIPFEDENVLNLVRAIYIGSNLIIAGIYFYIQLQINKKKGKRKTPFLRIQQHSRRILHAHSIVA